MASKKFPRNCSDDIEISNFWDMIQFNVFVVPTLLSFKVESYLSVFVFRIPYDGIPPFFLGMPWDFCWDPMDFG